MRKLNNYNNTTTTTTTTTTIVLLDEEVERGGKQFKNDAQFTNEELWSGAILTTVTPRYLNHLGWHVKTSLNILSCCCCCTCFKLYSVMLAGTWQTMKTKTTTIIINVTLCSFVSVVRLPHLYEYIQQPDSQQHDIHVQCTSTSVNHESRPAMSFPVLRNKSWWPDRHYTPDSHNASNLRDNPNFHWRGGCNLLNSLALKVFYFTEI